MIATRSTAAFSLAVFLFGGLLPAMLHGPAHEHATTSVESADATATPAGCLCGHSHDAQTPTERDEATPDAPSEQECPICELIGVVVLRAELFELPTRCDRITPVAVGSTVTKMAAPIALPLLRGPPCV